MDDEISLALSDNDLARATKAFDNLTKDMVEPIHNFSGCSEDCELCQELKRKLLCIL